MLLKIARVIGPVLALCLVASPAFAVEPTPYTPQQGALFNDPYRNDGVKRWELMHHVEDTIDAVPPGETILLTTFLMDRRVITEKLIAARDRGVSVRVIFDGDIDDPWATALETGYRDSEDVFHPGLNNDNDGPVSIDPSPHLEEPNPPPDPSWGADKSYVKRCFGSCRGAGGNMHSKIYMFSKAVTGSAPVEDIVMVSSANLNAGGALKGYNDLYTMTGRQNTWNIYEDIHEEMTQDTKGDVDRYRAIPDGVYEHRFFPMRTATQETDPVMVDLSKVACRGPRDGTGIDNKTALYVSMFYWDGERGVYIRDRLLELANLGCKVHIVYGAPAKIIAPKLKRYASQGKIKLWDSRFHTDDDGEVDIRMHAKYMLVDGRMGGDRSVRRVFTGSQNWVGGSLTRGDETMLVVDDPAAAPCTDAGPASPFCQYLGNFEHVTRAETSRPMHPVS